MTIEFFHDVICSFCFPMSYRMRKIKELMPDVDIVHRSYALVKNESDFDMMFGSRAAAKDEVLGHWAHANQNDDLHRFNIEGMRKANFPFPSSMKVLTACKAAYFTGGNDAYWDVFDALQNALFVKSLNIEDLAIIEQCVKESGVDFEQWQNHFNSNETKAAVESDLQLVKDYGIRGVPCLIIDGKYQISGAQGLDQIVNALQRVQKME